jgi:hypothetical protein
MADKLLPVRGHSAPTNEFLARNRYVNFDMFPMTHCKSMNRSLFLSTSQTSFLIREIRETDTFDLLDAL